MARRSVMVRAASGLSRQVRGPSRKGPDVSAPVSLLTADDIPPVTVLNPEGRSAFLIVADHAGNRLPRSVGTLGLGAVDRERHIAWDIGIAGVCRALSDLLDATLIQQNYSRLLIDCNRPLGAAQSIPAESDATPVPGNQGIGVEDRRARETEIFLPYHTRIATELARRQAEGAPAILLAMHSFTPVFAGFVRPWHAGLLYHRDARFAQALMPLLRADAALNVGDNEPYAVSEETDWTIPEHGEGRGIPHVGIEIRQDLVGRPDGQQQWAERLAPLFAAAAARLEETGELGAHRTALLQD